MEKSLRTQAQVMTGTKGRNNDDGYGNGDEANVTIGSN